jgi:hypothetical protein
MGQVAPREILSVTLPICMRDRPLRPCHDMTTRSTRSSRFASSLAAANHFTSFPAMVRIAPTPLTAVGRIVVVVAVLVMDRQLVQFLAGKLAPAPGAYPWQNFQRLMAIDIAATLALTARFGQDPIQRVICPNLRPHRSSPP